MAKQTVENHGENVLLPTIQNSNNELICNYTFNWLKEIHIIEIDHL